MVFCRTQHRVAGASRFANRLSPDATMAEAQGKGSLEAGRYRRLITISTSISLPERDQALNNLLLFLRNP